MTAVPPSIEGLLGADLAVALESDQFKQFLDHVPVAIAVADLSGVERIVYANNEFERVSGVGAGHFVGGGWASLPGTPLEEPATPALADAIVEARDYLGGFQLPGRDGPLTVDAWSNIIEDDDGAAAYRLVALVETQRQLTTDRAALEAKVQIKDMQLRELQHRVKNNLQMITALIRIEARGLSGDETGDRFDRLAGRVEALGLLYRSISDNVGEGIDLGVYLSEIASAVMRAHAVEGIHLDMQVDTWPVSVDVAMPAGLVVNELLTNALKHAFQGRAGGKITLHCLNTPAGGCHVKVGDDGVGLPEGASWPTPGKLSALIVKSLVQNAKATIAVTSTVGEGTEVDIAFSCPVAPAHPPAIATA